MIMNYFYFRKNGIVRYVVFIISMVLLGNQDVSALDFPYKNWVWADPDCDNPLGIVTWVEMKNGNMFRYDLDERGLSKNQLKTIDVSPYGEAIFSSKIDAKSREVLFTYVKEDKLEVYVINNKMAQAVYKQTGSKEETEGFAELKSCQPTSNAAKRIFRLCRSFFVNLFH